MSLKYLHQSDSKIGIKMILPMGRSGFFYSILCSVAILKACIMIQSMITSATKTSWRNNVIPTNKFSSSSYRVLSQSFCPQNISLLPKAWFPYDRPDRPDCPSRLKNVQTIRTIIWKRYPDDCKRPGRLRRRRSLG